MSSFDFVQPELDTQEQAQALKSYIRQRSGETGVEVDS